MTCGLASHHNSFQFRDSRQDSLSLFSKCVVLTTNPSSLLFNPNVLIMSVSVNFKSRYIVVSTLDVIFLANRKYFCQILTQLFCSYSKIGRYEVSQGIKARKSLYENNQQSETTQDQRRDSVSKAPKETEVVTKKQKYIVEKKEVEEEKTENKAKDKKERNSSNSSQQGK